MAATLKQIAKIVGVSRGTVDRALHNRGRVNDKTAELIIKTAKELNYQPNKIGRALALAKNPIKLGVIVQSAETPFMKLVMEGISRAIDELKETSTEIYVKELCSIGAEQAITAIDELLEIGVNGIAILPTNDVELQNKINNIINEQNIPVVAFNSEISNADILCFIGLDDYRSGETCGNLMGKMLSDGDTILPLSGHMRNRSHNLRAQGFTDEIRKSYPKLEVLPLQYCFDNDDNAREITLHIIDQYPNLKGIFIAANGQNGVSRAIEEAGKKDKIRIIGYDLTPKNKENLLNGNIDFLIGQNSFAQGYKPLMTLYDYLFEGKMPESKNLFTDIVIKNKYNI